MEADNHLNYYSLTPLTLMTRTLVNLTLSIVKEEAALLAEHFPHPIYQDVLGNAEAKQELITYVLSQIPNTYALTAATNPINARGQTTAYRLQIETLLKQGIDYISGHRLITASADAREAQSI